MRTISLAIVLLLGPCLIHAQTLAPANLSGDYQIAGRAVDSRTGDPVSGAWIEIFRIDARSKRLDTFAGDDGEFVFEHLAAGTYRLWAERKGYIGQSLDQHGSYSTAVVTGPELESTNLVFRLTAECSISGTITDEAGEPVRDAEVSLYAAAAANRGQQRQVNQVTNGEGYYGFYHLRPGEYSVSVLSKVWYAQRPLIRADLRVVTESTGNRWTSAQGMNQAGDYDEEQGLSPLDVAYPVTFYPGTIDPRARTLITLQAGEKFIANVQLAPVRALHFHFDGGDAATKGMHVQMQEQMTNGSRAAIFSEARISKSGSVDIVGVPPGQYRMEVTGSGEDDVLSRQRLDVRESGSVAAKDIPSVAVSADVEAQYSLDGLQLRLVNVKTHEPLTEPIPKDGHISFKQRAVLGDYEISLFDNTGSSALFLKNASAVGTMVIGRTVSISGLDPVRIRVAVGQGQGRVTGRVVRNGQPAQGALVLLVPADPIHNRVLFRRGQSSSDGGFSIAPVVPGKYTILALENGWNLDLENDPGVLKPYIQQGQSLDIRPNSKQDVRITVQ